MTDARILLVEDHTLVRAGFRMLLEKIQGVVVIGEASDGLSAIKMAKDLEPDVVLMDIAMQGMNGLEATGRIRQEGLGTKILCYLCIRMKNISRKRFARVPPAICSRRRSQ